MTTTVYNYQFVPVSQPAGTIGTFVSIQAYQACDTKQPIASAFYRIQTATSGSGGGPTQLCSGNNTVGSGMTVSWDGTTVNNSNGFTVTINGSPTVNQPQPPGLSLQSPTTSTPCNQLPNNGAYIPCKPIPIPTTTLYEFLFYPASQLNGTIAVMIGAYNACDIGKPMSVAGYANTPIVPPANSLPKPKGPPVQLCPGNNIIAPGVIVTWDGTTINNVTGFSMMINGSPGINQPLPLGLPSSLSIPCNTLLNNGNSITCIPGGSPISVSSPGGPSLTAPTTTAPLTPPKKNKKGIAIAGIIIGVIIFLLIIGLILFFILRKK